MKKYKALLKCAMKQAKKLGAKEQEYRAEWVEKSELQIRIKELEAESVSKAQHDEKLSKQLQESDKDSISKIINEHKAVINQWEDAFNAARIEADKLFKENEMLRKELSEYIDLCLNYQVTTKEYLDDFSSASSLAKFINNCNANVDLRQSLIKQYKDNQC